MHFVAEHPEWEREPFDVAFSADYGSFESMADLFRQIGHDERVHKQDPSRRSSNPASADRPRPAIRQFRANRRTIRDR